MDDRLRSILHLLANEIEELRAHQVLIIAALQALPSFSQTDMEKLKNAALDKNRAAYEELRQSIAGL